MRYEYKVIDVTGEPVEEIEATLNYWGKGGWKVVNVQSGIQILLEREQ